MRSLVFTVPGLKPVNPLNGSHGHWSTRSRRKRTERSQVIKAAPGAVRASFVKGVPKAAFAHHPELPVEVTLTRVYAGHGKPMDVDGLAASLKGVIDAVAELLMVDDGDESAVSWRFAQVRGGKAAVVVEIESRPAVTEVSP